MEKQAQPIEVAQVQDVTVVRFTQKSIHVGTLEPLSQELLGLVQEATPQKFLLNLGPVQYLYSDFLELLLRLRKRILANQGKLALCNLQTTAREVIVTTHLHLLIPLHDSEEGGLKELTGA